MMNEQELVRYLQTQIWNVILRGDNTTRDRLSAIADHVRGKPIKLVEQPDGSYAPERR